MTDPWGRRGARTVRDGAPRDITEDHIVRLEKWVQVLDAVIEENQQKQHRLLDQNHVDQGDRGDTTDHKL
jgi:hypothetical protein